MPLVQELPSPRRRRWTRIETIAWIAYRRFDLVQRAALLAQRRRRRKGGKFYPLTRLVVVASILRPAQNTKGKNPARRIAAAERLLRCLERRGLLSADKHDKYDRQAVQRLVRSKEGRGAGQQKRPWGDYRNIAKLGWYFLTTPPEDRAPLGEAYAWGVSEGLPKRYERQTEMRKQALAWAARELGARERSPIGFADARKASQNEFAEIRSNLERWQALISDPEAPTVHTRDE